MDVQRLLDHGPGTWEGEYRLWFRPAEAPDSFSATRATVTSELGGNGLLLRYEWRYGDDAHEGLAVIRRTDAGGLQMGWSDTFHYKDGVMHGVAVGTSAAVLGRYGPPDEPWGWRTEFDVPDSDLLEIRAFNILPDGTEALATEARYRRRA